MWQIKIFQYSVSFGILSASIKSVALSLSPLIASTALYGGNLHTILPGHICLL